MSGTSIRVRELKNPQTVLDRVVVDGREYLLTTGRADDEHAPLWWIIRDKDGDYHVWSYQGTRRDKAGMPPDDKHRLPYVSVEETSTFGVIKCEHEYGWDETGFHRDTYTYTNGPRRAVVRVYDERPDRPDWHMRSNATLDLYENDQPYGSGRRRTYNYADNARSKAIRFCAGDNLRNPDVRRGLDAKPVDDTAGENLRIIKELTGGERVPFELTGCARRTGFDLLDNPNHEQVSAYVKEWLRLHAEVEKARKAEQEAMQPYNEWEREWKKQTGRRQVFIEDMKRYPGFDGLMEKVERVTKANTALAEGMRRLVEQFNTKGTS